MAADVSFTSNHIGPTRTAHFTQGRGVSDGQGHLWFLCYSYLEPVQRSSAKMTHCSFSPPGPKEPYVTFGKHRLRSQSAVWRHKDRGRRGGVIHGCILSMSPKLRVACPAEPRRVNKKWNSRDFVEISRENSLQHGSLTID